MQKILTDEKLNQLMDTEGYLVLKLKQPNLSASICQVFEKYKSDCHFSSGFHSTHFSNNVQYKKEVFNLALKIFDENFKALFNGYKVLFSNLMVKLPSTSNIVPVHADWVYLDEKRHTAISLWIPVVNTSNRNDVLGVIPKSHLIYDEFRGPNIISPLRKYDEIIMNHYGKSLPISPSEAIVYNLKLQHYSRPNTSNDTRIAINITIIPQDAEVIHYFQSNQVINKYRHLDETFFFNYHNHHIPEGRMPDEIFQKAIQMSESEIIEFYKLDHLHDKKENSLLDKLKHYLKNDNYS